MPLLAPALMLVLLPVSGARLRTEVVFSETANLAYQLDMVSGLLVHLDPADYKALWETEFLRTEEDRRHLKRWAALRERYAQSLAIPTAPMPLESIRGYVTLSEQMRVASLRARNRDEFVEGASLLMLPADVAQLSETMRHFEAPFRAWWRREAEGKGRAFVSSTRALLNRPSIQGRIEQFRRFYGPALPPDAKVTFSLLYRPDRAKAPTSGQQLGSVGAVEFLGNERAEDRLPVVLHEFCHYLFGARPDEANIALQQRLMATQDSAVKPSLNLMNEGLASAFGNGVIEREIRPADKWVKYLAAPRSFYNDANIDRAGKALLSLTDAWIAQGRTMDDPGFPTAYLSAMKAAFGDELTRPLLFLNEAFLFVDEPFGLEFSREVRNRLRVASAYTRVRAAIDADAIKPFTSQPNLSAVFVVRPNQLPALEAEKILTPDQARILKAGAEQEGSQMMGLRRSPYSRTFIIVASDVEAARREVGRLADELRDLSRGS